MIAGRSNTTPVCHPAFFTHTGTASLLLDHTAIRVHLFIDLLKARHRVGGAFCLLATGEKETELRLFAKIGSIFSLCWLLLSLLLKWPVDIKFPAWQPCPSSLLQVLCRLPDTPPTLCFLWSCPVTSLSSTGPSEASPCWPHSTTEQLLWQQRHYCAAFVHSAAEILVKRPFGQQVSLVIGERLLSVAEQVSLFIDVTVMHFLLWDFDLDINWQWLSLRKLL